MTNNVKTIKKNKYKIYFLAIMKCYHRHRVYIPYSNKYNIVSLHKFTEVTSARNIFIEVELPIAQENMPFHTFKSAYPIFCNAPEILLYYH